MSVSTPGAASWSGRRATSRPSASSTRRISRRRSAANARVHSRCQVHVRNGDRRRLCATRWSHAATPTASRRTTTSVFTDLRSEEHTSELQSLAYLVCRLLLEKKKKEQT